MTVKRLPLMSSAIVFPAILPLLPVLFFQQPALLELQAFKNAQKFTLLDPPQLMYLPVFPPV
jgi:hypothetical protein